MISFSNGPSFPRESPREQLAIFVDEVEAFYRKPTEPFEIVVGERHEHWVAAGKLYTPQHGCFDRAAASIVRIVSQDAPLRYALSLQPLGLPEHRFVVVEGEGGEVLDAHGDPVHHIPNFNVVRDVVGSLVVYPQATLALAQQFREPLSTGDELVSQLYSEFPVMRLPGGRID